MRAPAVIKRAEPAPEPIAKLKPLDLVKLRLQTGHDERTIARWASGATVRLSTATALRRECLKMNIEVRG